MIVVLYLIFSILVVSVLYAGTVFLPSLLFIYPRTFGGDLSNKVFGVSILLFFTIWSVIILFTLARNDRKKTALYVFSDTLGKFRPEHAVLFIFICIIPFLVSYFVFLRFPNSADEFLYLFQAKIFADGALAAAAPPVPELFTTTWMVEHAGKWAAMFPPGWPAVIAAFTSVGLPDWSVNPVLGIVSVTLVYYLCSLQYPRSTALAASLLYGTSIFFVFNAGSFFSHVSFVIFSLFYAIFVVLFSKTNKGWYLVGAGTALAIAVTIRYYPGVLMGLPLVFCLYRWRALPQGAAFLALGGVPVAIALAAYHAIVFGSPLSTGYSFQPENLSSTELGLDVVAGLHSNLVRIWELGAWVSPMLAMMYLVAMIYRVRSRSLTFTDTLFPVVLLGLVFFAEPGGNRYGPRYLFDAFPFFVICAVAGVFDFVRDKSDVVRNAARHAVIMTTVYSLCLLPFVAVFLHNATWERTELDRLIETEGVENAIVIVRAGTGRILRFNNLDLVKNDPDLTNDVLFVRPTDDEELLTSLYPSRSIWVFDRERGGTSPGELIRLR